MKYVHVLLPSAVVLVLGSSCNGLLDNADRTGGVGVSTGGNSAQGGRQVANGGGGSSSGGTFAAGGRTSEGGFGDHCEGGEASAQCGGTAQTGETGGSRGEGGAPQSAGGVTQTSGGSENTGAQSQGGTSCGLGDDSGLCAMGGQSHSVGGDDGGGQAGAGPTTCADRTTQHGVFVNGFAGTDGECGATEALACKTIGAGIARAKTLQLNAVYVAPGAYGEAVKLPAGMRIEGGWAAQGAHWVADCGANAAARIKAPTSEEKTVQVLEPGAEASLAWLTIETRDTPTGSGKSSYGVFVQGAGTKLLLDHVRVISLPASNGTDGSPATTAAAAAATTTCPSSPSDGANATTPGSNPGLTADVFSASGYIPGSGAEGGPGQAGHNGALNATNNCIQSPTRCWACSSDSCVSAALPCGQTPKPGCGGPGGPGGKGGNGGGASIAVYVWDAVVRIQDSDLRAHDGGLGGKGIAGGNGGAGAPAAGEAKIATCSTTCTPTTIGAGNNSSGTFSCEMSGTAASTLATAGPGGKGSTGGKGADGTPGRSCALFVNTPANLTLSGSLMMVHVPATSADHLGGTAQTDPSCPK